MMAASTEASTSADLTICPISESGDWPISFRHFHRLRLNTDSGVGINLLKGGAGPPLLLLHGYPQTHLCWHKVAPGLARHFTLVIPDLRGYGDLDKPAGGTDHSGYSKRVIAQDQIDTMTALGFPSFRVAGHDRGGRVAHRLALDHPGAVERLAVLDIAPTATMYAKTDKIFATAYYHWFFLIQPFDLPERLIGAAPDYYLRSKLGHWGRTKNAFPEEVVTEYARCFRDPAAIHASCEDYRAAASIDLEHDAADDRAGHRIKAPLLALWGAKGFVGRAFDVLASWREKSDAPVSGHPVPSGHFLPEEAPDETASALIAFFLARFRLDAQAVEQHPIGIDTRIARGQTFAGEIDWRPRKSIGLHFVAHFPSSRGKPDIGGGHQDPRRGHGADEFERIHPTRFQWRSGNTDQLIDRHAFGMRGQIGQYLEHAGAIGTLSPIPRMPPHTLSFRHRAHDPMFEVDRRTSG